MEQEFFRKYPIGIQAFEKIIESGSLYIDKTRYIVKFLERNYNYIFLSRPRRFGKSLFLSTLKAYFEGKKELFKGLAIDAYEKEWVQYPVLHFSMAGIKDVDTEKLNNYLNERLKPYEKIYGFDSTTVGLNDRLNNLIKTAYEKTGKKVVVLIDEYDAPLLDVAKDAKTLEAIREIMRNFYSPIKDCDTYIQFAFLTGITKFSQLSIFSELNNLENISMLDEFSGICGITYNELVTQLQPDIESLAKKIKQTYEQTLERLKQTYDGYRFSTESEDIFNPFSLLSCFKNRSIKNYWFSTGTPTYIINFMKKYSTRPVDLGGKYRVSESEFDVPIEQARSILPLLYQSGYLTIKGYNELLNIYTLEIPNKEVRIGLMENLVPNYVQTTNTPTVIGDILGCFYEQDIKGGLDMLAKFFKTVPYCDNTNYEGHWQQVLYVVLSLMGGLGDVEMRTAEGRIDLVMYLWGKLYLIETKINQSAKVALNQINLKDYAERFSLLNVPIIKIGMNFEVEGKELTYEVLQ